jgi:ATP/maltotriose-dependent transcriptional regulator MalT
MSGRSRSLTCEKRANAILTRLVPSVAPPLAALLRSLIRTRPGARRVTTAQHNRQQVNRILLAFHTHIPTSRPPGSDPGLVEQLTTRELEVLQLIAQGRHNREIAHDLVVTLDTVKKHASHILSKIGATSRTQAVARARD